MLTLIDTWGGSTSNTYISLEDADLLITMELLDSEPWASAAESQRRAALASATRNIDSYNWVGEKYFFQQLLQFPRTPQGADFFYGPYGRAESDAQTLSLMNQDEYLRKQRIRVRRACAIQANYLLRTKGRNLDRETQFIGATSRSSSHSGVSIAHHYAHPSHRLCPEAMDELRYYLGKARLVRGSSSGVRYTD